MTLHSVSFLTYSFSNFLTFFTISFTSTRFQEKLFISLYISKSQQQLLNARNSTRLARVKPFVCELI